MRFCSFNGHTQLWFIKNYTFLYSSKSEWRALFERHIIGRIGFSLQVIGREEANMGYNNFLYLLNDALKNNHIELALASLKTFRAADIADLLTQLSM